MQRVCHGFFSKSLCSLQEYWIASNKSRAPQAPERLRPFFQSQEHAHLHEVPVGYSSTDIPLSEVGGFRN